MEATAIDFVERGRHLTVVTLPCSAFVIRPISSRQKITEQRQFRQNEIVILCGQWNIEFM